MYFSSVRLLSLWLMGINSVSRTCQGRKPCVQHALPKKTARSGSGRFPLSLPSCSSMWSIVIRLLSIWSVPLRRISFVNCSCPSSIEKRLTTICLLKPFLCGNFVPSMDCDWWSGPHTMLSPSVLIVCCSIASWNDDDSRCLTMPKMKIIFN